MFNKVLKGFIQNSIQKIINEHTLNINNKDRSKYFVEYLAENFQNYYNQEEFKVFSKYNKKNRADFQLNEYLYDILVCKIGKVKAAKQNKELKFIKEVFWLIESEFKKDSHAAIIDFNKLVIGNSKFKLFVGSISSVTDSYLATLLPLAEKCNGDVYIILMDHPKDWDKKDISIIIWKLENGWTLI